MKVNCDSCVSATSKNSFKKNCFFTTVNSDRHVTENLNELLLNLLVPKIIKYLSHVQPQNGLSIYSFIRITEKGIKLQILESRK